MDAWHEIGGDLDLDSTGDLRQAGGSLHGRQRVLRRLMSNPGEYIWHASYGAGLATFVGQVLNAPRLTAIIQAQMFRERAVAQSPAPVVAVASAQTSGSSGEPFGFPRAGTPAGTVAVSVRYVDARQGQPVSAQLSIAP